MGNKKKLIELITGEEDNTMRICETRKPIDVIPIGKPTIIYTPADVPLIEFRKKEIRKKAPVNANAYLIGRSHCLSGGIIVEKEDEVKKLAHIYESFFPIQYFKIKE